MPTEKEKKDYYNDRWVAQQVVKGKIQVGAEKLNKLKATYPRVFAVEGRINNYRDGEKAILEYANSTPTK